ncbi:MAG: hypothetical protein ACYC7D_01265 [Nitrososphaerales archaeon]
MQWISFELHHYGDFNKLSSKYPTLLMARWSNGKLDVLEFFCKDPIVFAHVKADLLKLSRKRKIEIICNITSFHDILI